MSDDHALPLLYKLCRPASDAHGENSVNFHALHTADLQLFSYSSFYLIVEVAVPASGELGYYRIKMFLPLKVKTQYVYFIAETMYFLLP